MRKLLQQGDAIMMPKSSCVSMRVLRVVIFVLSLVYIILQVQLHYRHPRHRHHHQHSPPPPLPSHHYYSRKDEKNDKEPREDEKGAASTVVAVGFFPNAERESGETSGEYDNNGGGNAEEEQEDEQENEEEHYTAVDWEDLYTRGIVASHSCRIRKNEQNVTFLQSPDFILAGVQKAGTTALFALLSLHPEIIASRHFEEHFFDMRYGGLMENWRWKQHLAGQALSCAAAQAYVERMDFEPLIARKMKQQQQQQQQQPQRFLTFEKTPNYIIWPHVPKAIAETCPWKPKIIIMLRNPVDRLYSHYQMHFVQDEGVASLEDLLNRELRLLRHFGLSHAPNVPAVPTTLLLSLSEEAMFTNNETTMAMFQVPNITKMYRDDKDSINFRGFGNHGDYLRFLYRGMYYFQLERWLKYFQLGDNLLVIPYEQFKNDPQSVMQQVYMFVGAASSFQLTRAQLKATYRPAIDQENRKDMIPAQPLAPSTRRYLEHFYRPYNERLYGLLGEEWRGVWEHKEEK